MIIDQICLGEFQNLVYLLTKFILCLVPMISHDTIGFHYLKLKLKFDIFKT